MKKTLITLSAVLLASCGNDTFQSLENAPAAPARHHVTFYAESENEPQVSASIQSDRTITWEAADAISVLDAGTQQPSNTRFDLSDGAGTTSGTFEADAAPVAESGRYFAVYPYSSSISLSNDTLKNLLLPHVQRLNGTAGHDAAAAMMAAVTTSSNLAFKNVCAYIKFTIGQFSTGAVQRVDFVSNGSEKISGSFNLTFDAVTGLPVVEEDNAMNASIVTLLPEGSTFGQDVTCYLAVLPDTLSTGFTITFSNAERKYTRKTTRSVELTRGGILNLGTFNDQTDWSYVTTAALAGKGTANDPFIVASSQDLHTIYVRLENLDMYNDRFRQVCDIDCGNSTVHAIGNHYTQFQGTYDGCGHRISGIKTLQGQTYSHDSYIGLFAFVNGGTVKNVTIDLQGSEALVTGAIYYGGIAGYVGGNASTFENCTVNGLVSAEMDYSNICVGGIAGVVGGNATFTRCTNNASVVSVQDADYNADREAAGGIIGYIRFYDYDGYVRLDRCRNTGAVSVTAGAYFGSAGGLIGWVYEQTGLNDVALRLTNCVNKGSVSATRSYDGPYGGSTFYGGGLVGNLDCDGYTDNDPFVCNCVNTGAVHVHNTNGGCYVGGLTGFCYDEDTHFRVCANFAPLSGESTQGYEVRIGGVAGFDLTHLFNLDIKYCYMLTGGYMAYNKQASDYEGCQALTSITSSQMNSIIGRNVTFGGIFYADWIGQDGSLDLDF